jgi:hypothetical protein
MHIVFVVAGQKQHPSRAASPKNRCSLKRSANRVVTHFENLDSKPGFRGYGSVSPNLAEQRLGSPWGPVRGTAG